MVSNALLAFIGNVSIERQEEGYVPVEDLTYVSPDPRCDSVFIDRRARSRLLRFGSAAIS